MEPIFRTRGQDLSAAVLPAEWRGGVPAPEDAVSENLTPPRSPPLVGLALGHPPLGHAPPVGLGSFMDGYPAAAVGVAQTAILACPLPAAPRHLAALRVLTEEHIAVHGGLLRPLGPPHGAILIRTAREHVEALDAGLCLLLGEGAVARFDLPERADALSERLAADPRPAPAFAVALAAVARPLLRLAPAFHPEALDPEALAAVLATLDGEAPEPPPLLTLRLACLRDEAFLRFAARHRRRAGRDGAGLVAAVPLADLLAQPEAARRAAAALAHANHRLGAALPAHAWRLFDPRALPASLLVTPWDPLWHADEPALARAEPARILATGVDSAAALAACRAAGIGAVAGAAATRLLRAGPPA